jgi:hypothetical protein
MVHPRRDRAALFAAVLLSSASARAAASVGPEPANEATQTEAPGEGSKAEGPPAPAVDPELRARPELSDAPVIGELSEQGTRRGALEFGVASVMAGAGLGLIAWGTVELFRTRRHAEFCEAAGAGEGIDPCVFDPPPLGWAAVGLSYGFSIPLLVGSGLLYARGVRVLRDARRYRAEQGAVASRLQLGAWWSANSGGGRLRLRF